MDLWYALSVSHTVADPGGRGQTAHHFFSCSLLIMLLGTSNFFLLASLATIPPTYKAVLNLHGYDFFLLFGNTTRTNIFLPLKATQLKVVMVLRNELQHPYEHLRFNLDQICQTLQNSRNLQSFIMS